METICESWSKKGPNFGVDRAWDSGSPVFLLLVLLKDSKAKTSVGCCRCFDFGSFIWVNQQDSKNKSRLQNLPQKVVKAKTKPDQNDQIIQTVKTPRKVSQNIWNKNSDHASSLPPSPRKKKKQRLCVFLGPGLRDSRSGHWNQLRRLRRGWGSNKWGPIVWKIQPINQWGFLVPLIGGRYHIIPQLAVYTTHIPLIYCHNHGNLRETNG